MATQTADDKPSPRQPRRLSNAVRAALPVSLIYLVLGLTWISVSDDLLAYLVPADQLSRIQTYKGSAFIIITAVLLFLLVRYFVRSIQSTQTHLQQNLAQVAGQYQMLFQRNPFAMWVYDPDSLKILDVNHTAIRTYGYSREEFLALRITDLRDPSHVPQLLSDLSNQPPGPRTSGPWPHRKKDGSHFDVEILSDAIEFNNQPARLVLALDITERLKAERFVEQTRAQLEERVAARTRDLNETNQKLQDEIRERRHAEAMLREAKHAADEANAAKSTFLATTSHEIRTPLTSILGYADLLLDDTPQVSNALTPEARKQLLILQQSATHLLKLIDDLSDLSRIEMGRMRWSFEHYSPRDIAEQALEVLRPRAAEKKVALALELAANLPDFIHTDGVRVRQVLINLLNNAIKFTPPSSLARVTLRVQTAAHDAIRFDITDTGVGIPADHLQRIFEPFYQVEQSSAGTGLGLAISRQIVEHLGGSIHVDSQPGQGSTFSLTLPLNPPEISSTPSAQPSAQRIAGHILLAEDNENIRLLVEEYLRRAGASVTPVFDGLQALKAVQDPARRDHPFDLILLDVHMPIMDGEESMRHMRSAGYLGPIVILTAQPQPEDSKRLQLAGADAIAAKPIDRQTFIPLLARLLRNQQPAV